MHLLSLLLGVALPILLMCALPAASHPFGQVLMLLLSLAVSMLAAMWLAFVVCGLAVRSRPIIRALAAVTGGCAVELIDYSLERRYSLAHAAENGGLTACWYLVGDLGPVRLLDHSMCDPDGDTSFIYIWLPLAPQARAMALMTSNLPDFEALARLSRDQRHDAMIRWRMVELERMRI
jgi:hypothetical protein